MIEKYIEKQADFYNYFKKVKDNNKINHAYLIETNAVDYSYELAIDLAKFFLFDGINNEQISDLIDLGNFPDLKIIDTQGKQIKKEDMLEVQKEFSTKSVYGNKLIYIVKDASLLNSSSANTMLKFLEEPSKDVIAILLADDISKVIDTIVSRCQIVTLINNDSKSKYINDIKNDSSLMEEMINYIDMFEEKKERFIGSKTSYKFNNNLELFLNLMLTFYIDIFNSYFNKKCSYLDDFYEQKAKIKQNNKFDDIIIKINIINEFINKSNFNVNKELFIDNFLISLLKGESNG